jgi:hypothetical protein
MYCIELLKRSSTQLDFLFYDSLVISYAFQKFSWNFASGTLAKVSNFVSFFNLQINSEHGTGTSAVTRAGPVQWWGRLEKRQGR